MIPNHQDSIKISKEIGVIDDSLSQRFIALDSNGYFLVKLDREAQEIVAEHFSNDIDDLGRAIDPETGKLLSCEGELVRAPVAIYRGRSAKELGIRLTEGAGPHPITQLDHALYMGRELQRAEVCLIEGSNYIQD